MEDVEWVEQCKAKLRAFADEMVQRTASLPDDDSLRELALAFAELSAADHDLYDRGPELIARLFTTYPDFSPLLPRDLLWFFGGECLHYMPDEEIAAYEQGIRDNA